MFDLLALDAGDEEAIIHAAVESHGREDGRHAFVQLPYEEVFGIERHSTDEEHRPIRKRLGSAHEASSAIWVRPPHVDSAFAVLVVHRILYLPRKVVLRRPRPVHREEHKFDLLSNFVVRERPVVDAVEVRLFLSMLCMAFVMIRVIPSYGFVRASVGACCEHVKLD